MISAASRLKFIILWGHVEEILLLNIFPVVDNALVAKNKIVPWCPDGDFLAIFLRPAFPASHVQYISDLHSKCALRPHYVWKYGRHPICDG